MFLNFLFYIFRAIDFESLLGTVGGYIGLILGYTILQIPEFLVAVFRKSKLIKERLVDTDVTSPQVSIFKVLPFTKKNASLMEPKMDSRFNNETVYEQWNNETV